MEGHLVTLEIEDAVAELVSDAIDFYLEGHEEAEAQVAQDRTHETVESMMASTNTMRQQRIELLIVGEQLRSQLAGGVI